MLNILVSFIVDEIALSLKELDVPQYKALLKTVISIKINNPTTKPTTIMIKFIIKNIDEELGVLRLNRIVKEKMTEFIKVICRRVEHRIKLYRLRSTGDAV
jgi:hypothetical protein